MSDHIVEDGAFINSIVGEGTRFRGELDLNGLLRIDGDYSGVIRTPDKVLVGKNGRAECTIYAGEVVIGGVIKGDVYSREKVIVLSTGMVIGNIHSPRLIVEEGVILNGTYKITKEYDPREDSNIVSEEQAPQQNGVTRDDGGYGDESIAPGANGRETGDTYHDYQKSGTHYSVGLPAAGQTAETGADNTDSHADGKDVPPAEGPEKKVSAWNG